MTIQELYDEVMARKELKEKFIEAAKAGKQDEFLKAHGCEATPEEVAAFLKAKSEEDAPLSLDELENSAGGECNEKTTWETIGSVWTAGIGCAILAAVSAGIGHVGRNDESEGRICN